jgi:CzcA family heavy metal efflux pump
MIRSITASSLRFRLIVIGVALGVMAVGIAQLRAAPVDVLPEFTPPYVEVQTEALGLSADEVESLITVPLEVNLLNGVQGVDVIRSESVAGLSSIVMVFEPETDLYQARQLVQERLIEAHALPNVSKPPTMIQPLSSSSRVMMIGLDPQELSPIEASVISRWVIKPRLMGVPGVANVAIWGMRDQQLQVQVDPEHLRDRGVTLNQVVATAGNAQLVSPLTFLEASTPGTGGFIESPNQRLQIQHDFDKLASPEGLGRVPVEGTGGKLRLADVANVEEGRQPLIGDAIVDGGDGLLLVVEKFPGADTLEVTRGVDEALDKLRPGLSGMDADPEPFRPATYIEDGMDNLKLALILAGVLLVLALAAFLFEWRTVLIGLVTIPLSLVAAALVLHLLGETFNALAFAGLAVAIAVVIDDAVVGVHNVARCLREHRRAGGEESTAEVVLEAFAEVRSPITYAVFIALLPIVPVAVMGGRPGAFFEPLTLSYVLAVLVSMVVALTVAPALSLLLFSRGSPRPESPILRRLSPRYDGALSRFLRAPRATLIAVGVCVVVGLGALPLMDTSLIPSFEDRDVLVRLESPPGTSEPKMSSTAAQLGHELGEISGVENVSGHVGRAVTGDRIVDVNSSDLWVRIASDADYDATVAQVEDTVGRLGEAVDSEVATYSTQRIRDVGALYDGEESISGKNDLSILTGANRPLMVRLYGQNLDALRREANDVREEMSRVDGVVDPRVELPRGEPVLKIETDLARALRHGIKPGDVRRAEATLLQGIQVGSTFQEQKVFDVIVQGVPQARESVSTIRELLIDRPGGGHVRLGDVADVRIGQAPAVIQRDAASRYVDIEADVNGRNLGAVAGDVEDRLANVEFPLEYHAEVRTESTGQEVNLTRIVGFGIAAGIAVFLLLQAAFTSWRLAVLAFLTLPVALVGGVLAALIDGATLSLGSLIAFLALLGIASRNGVMLIHRFQRLRVDPERDGFGAELVRRGARDRFAPVLTTVSALVLLLLPFVIMGDVAGLEIVHPMAIVMLGGLLTTTLFSLFVLPALYLRFGAGAQPDVEFRIDPIRHWAGVEGERADGKGEVAAERQDDEARRERPAGAGSTLPTEDDDSASPERSGE